MVSRYERGVKVQTGAPRAALQRFHDSMLDHFVQLCFAYCCDRVIANGNIQQRAMINFPLFQKLEDRSVLRRAIADLGLIFRQGRLGTYKVGNFAQTNHNILDASCPWQTSRITRALSLTSLEATLSTRRLRSAQRYLLATVRVLCCTSS